MSRTTYVLSLALFLAAGCESDPMRPTEGDSTELSLPSAGARGGWRSRPKRKDPAPEPEPEPAPQPEPQPEPEPGPGHSDYQLVVADDFDPLWRFTVTGHQALLQTDPSVTSWGTDYWGYWSDPYTMTGNVVEYTVGLTHTTYAFTPLGDGRYDVTKTLVVQPYLGGGPTRTVTHPGIYGPAG